LESCSSFDHVTHSEFLLSPTCQRMSALAPSCLAFKLHFHPHRCTICTFPFIKTGLTPRRAQALQLAERGSPNLSAVVASNAPLCADPSSMQLAPLIATHRLGPSSGPYRHLWKGYCVWSYSRRFCTLSLSFRRRRSALHSTVPVSP
jgi:hypothetical protein